MSAYLWRAVARFAFTSVLMPSLAMGQGAPQQKSSRTEEEIQKAIDADVAAQKAPAPDSSKAASSSAAARGQQSFNPDIALIGDFAAAAFYREVEMLGGHDPAEPGFNLQSL